jgi:UDP-glucose 4-epimerase
MKKTILVTGSAGFIGSHLVDELIKRGHQVVGVDDLSGGYFKNVNSKSKFIKLDVRDFKRLDKLIKKEKIEIIFHLAAYAAEGQSVFSPIEINDINLTSINNLLVSAVNHNIKRFVFTSSMAVYGEQSTPFNENILRKPTDPYGCAKAYCERMIEIFAKTYGFEYVILRPHNVYGPRQNIADPFRNVLGIWINRILRNKPPYIYGNGEQKRAFSYIEDVIPAIANAGFSKKTKNQIINVGSDEVVTINRACKIVLETMNSKLRPIYIEGRPCEVKYAYCTIEKSKKLLGYQTKHSLREGIKMMAEWARKVGTRPPIYKIPLEIEKKAPKVWKEKLI